MFWGSWCSNLRLTFEVGSKLQRWLLMMKNLFFLCYSESQSFKGYQRKLKKLLRKKSKDI